MPLISYQEARRMGAALPGWGLHFQAEIAPGKWECWMMVSRILTGVLFAAMVASSGATAAPDRTKSQNPQYFRELDASVSASPIARFFGYGTTRVVVPYSGPQRPGTIIINTSERHLYLVLEGGQALRYGIGVGRVGFTWAGTTAVSAKREWPDWTPPSEMVARQPYLPRHMAGGIENPLGARALYLGSTVYRIHGSNEPETIGQAVSSGCFRMINEDVIDLYNRVPVGAKVIVMR
jgi:lipoprotein-anchoring transpeptidase ErfK/SrfK